MALLRDLDIFALLDADSQESRQFTTYLHYWGCLAAMVASRYPTSTELVTDLRARRSYTRLSGKASSAPVEEVRALLLNAWSSELALYLVEVDNAERLWLANQWAQVQSYYATSRMATAWMLVRDGAAPETHRSLLRGLASQVGSGDLYPQPWACTCTNGQPRSFARFDAAPATISNLSEDADEWSRLGQMLATTRERRVREHVERVKHERKLQRAPHGERSRQDSRLEPTTVFDFAWRTRTRSNYGDPAMFYVGTLTPARSRAFAEALRLWTDRTVLVFEALIAQRMQTQLIETATHFIARDRSRLADTLIGGRMRALGLL